MKRERWFGATGRKVPELALEGTVELEGALVLDDVADESALRAAHDRGTPIVVRASSADEVVRALARPEVASVLVHDPALLDLDLPELTYGTTPPVATYSICACDLEAGQWGVATQSKFLAVGSVVPWAEPHVGAIATQSYANPRYGPDGLALLREGLSAAEAIDRLTGTDDDRALRQVGIVDGLGRAASFTGEECHEWAGGRVGTGYAAQGNILVSAATVDALAETFEATEAASLAERLLDCLAAAQEAGGDRRGQQSAALLVVQRDGGYAGLSDSLVDLRIDDHEQPVAELRRLYGAHQALFGVTPRSQWVSVDAELRTEIEQRLATLGYERLEDWAGVENLEERVDGMDAVDPVVLAELRSKT